MNTSDVLKIVDHTLLAQTATWAEIREILDDAMKFQTASACIPAAYVKQAVPAKVQIKQLKERWSENKTGYSATPP